MPKSLVERYGSDIKLSKREQRRLEVTQSKKSGEANDDVNEEMED